MCSSCRAVSYTHLDVYKRQEYNHEIECKINECKQNTVSQIEEINKNIKKCEVDTDNKLSEISASCETEIQLLHDTVKNINQKCIQSECSKMCIRDSNTLIGMFVSSFAYGSDQFFIV